jgi:hypothetical protein
MSHLHLNTKNPFGGLGGPSMTSAALLLLFIPLLAACSDANPQLKQAVNEMIESPLQNTVISSFEIYPPIPIALADGRLSPVYCAESD